MSAIRRHGVEVLSYYRQAHKLPMSTRITTSANVLSNVRVLGTPK